MGVRCNWRKTKIENTDSGPMSWYVQTDGTIYQVHLPQFRWQAQWHT